MAELLLFEAASFQFESIQDEEASDMASFFAEEILGAANKMLTRLKAVRGSLLPLGSKIRISRS